MVASLSHAQAADIIRQAWLKVHGTEPKGMQVPYTQAIALLETGYGRIGQFAQMAAEGKYNWGNIERVRDPDGSCPAGWAPGFDQKPVCFRVFPTDVEAAAEYVKQLTLPYPVKPVSDRDRAFVQRRQGTRDAMVSGTPEDVSNAMHTPASVAYSASHGTYAQAIRNALSSIQRGGGVFPKLQLPPAPSLMPLLLAAGVFGGAVFLMRKGAFPMVGRTRFA